MRGLWKFYKILIIGITEERLIIIIVVNSLRIAFQNFSGISVNTVIIFTVAGNEFDFINFNTSSESSFLFGEVALETPASFLAMDLAFATPIYSEAEEDG